MLLLLLAAGLSAVPPAIGNLPPPLVAGTVVVLLAPPEPDAIGDQPFLDAVDQALGQADFTSMPTPGHSRYIAQVSVVRRHDGTVATRAPKERASAGIGSWGPALSVPFGSHKTVLRDLVTTTLVVRLIERSGQRQVWSGSALTVGADGTPVAAKLARAAISTFPQTIDTPVSVP